MEINAIIKKKEAKLKKLRWKELALNHTTKLEKFANKIDDKILETLLIGAGTGLLAIPFTLIPLAGNAPIGLIAAGITLAATSVATFGSMVFSKIYQKNLNKKSYKNSLKIKRVAYEIEKLKSLTMEKENIETKSVEIENENNNNEIVMPPKSIKTKDELDKEI